MNRKLAALAVATCAAAPVLAQRSITLYDIADIGMVRNSNVSGRSRLGMDRGHFQTSHIGFRGTEDLGDGMRAIFTLERGFNLDTGAPSSTSVFFNRQAFVGLPPNAAGTLPPRRQWTPIYDNLILLSGDPTFGVGGGSVDGIGGPGSTAARFGNTIGGTRIANSIKYTSPTWGDFRVNAMVGLGEVTRASSAGQLHSIGAAYKPEPLSAGLGYLTRNCAGTTGCTAAPAQDKVLAIGAGYDFDPAKLFGIDTNEKNGKTVRGADANVYHQMVQVPAGAALLAAGSQRLDGKPPDNEDIRQLNLLALYYLTKRTCFYTS